MRVITANPPAGVMIDGIYYPIRTDFRVWLRFAFLLEAKDGAHAIGRALDLCYLNKRPESHKKALFALMDFFLCGNEVEKHESRGPKVMSFQKDEEIIYASFLSEYGIDLSKEQMHWWRFMALLKSLGPDTALSRVMSVRAKKPSDIKDAALRRSLIRQKRLYALEDTEENTADVLAELFMAEEMI